MGFNSGFKGLITTNSVFDFIIKIVYFKIWKFFSDTPLLTERENQQTPLMHLNKGYRSPAFNFE